MKKMHKCMQVLLQHDAEINIQGKNGDTALMHVAYMTLCLAQSKKSQVFTRDGTFADMEQCMLSLIDAGADPNLKNDKECTALILGANCLRFVRKVIKVGADVNWMDKNGKTALNQPAGIGQANCVEKLIESGAEINSGSPPPLMAAALNGHVECLKLLIREGADLDTPNKMTTEP